MVFHHLRFFNHANFPLLQYETIEGARCTKTLLGGANTTKCEVKLDSGCLKLMIIFSLPFIYTQSPAFQLCDDKENYV